MMAWLFWIAIGAYAMLMVLLLSGLAWGIWNLLQDED